jgi:hypothetical protein
MIKAGQTVVSRDGAFTGVTTGAHYKCSLEGCTGHRVVVRWADKKITRPCSKGMVFDEKTNTWTIL